MGIQMTSETHHTIKIEPFMFRIGFVLRGGQFGIEPGYVVFQLEPLP